MKQGNSTVLVIYFIVVLVNLIGNYLENSMITNFSKVLLMPVLFRYLSSHDWEDKKLKRFLEVALIFSWLGDVFLIFSNKYPSTFVLGLSSFLLGHIAYIVANRTARSGKNVLGLVVPIILILLVFISGVTLINTLFPTLGPMKVPVILYAFVIMSMAISASLRYGRTSRISFWMVTIGALLFMLSDSMIALDKFHSTINNARVLIMSTYTIAQFLLIYGFIVHDYNQE